MINTSKETRRTEHHGVQAVEVRDEDGGSKHEQQDMAEDEIRAPKRQLDDLDDEFTRRLRHGVRAKATAIPATSPPSPVRLVVLELTTEEDGNEDLVDGALNGDDGDET